MVDSVSDELSESLSVTEFDSELLSLVEPVVASAESLVSVDEVPSVSEPCPEAQAENSIKIARNNAISEVVFFNIKASIKQLFLNK